MIWNGWALWDVWRFLNYESIPRVGRLARLEPGFGLANLIGLLATVMALLLMATSTDWAVRRLGVSAWKFLQRGAYTVFYLSALHTAYSRFMPYTAWFHRSVPADPNWFRYPFLALTAVLLLLQWAAFTRIVAKGQASLSFRAATD